MSEDGVSYRINASSGGPKEVIRLVGGKAVKSEVTESETAAYQVPPSDKYRVKIVGFYEPFETPRRAEWITPESPATHETMTRLEFEIMEGKGKGRRFTSRIPYKIHPKSNLGMVWLAAVGPITPSIEFTDILDKEIVIYVDRTEKVDENGNRQSYANPTWKTARSVGDESDDSEDWPAA